jgi:hypothetical protein
MLCLFQLMHGKEQKLLYQMDVFDNMTIQAKVFSSSVTQSTPSKEVCRALIVYHITFRENVNHSILLVLSLRDFGVKLLN